jgi:Spy/CpxP family protein refolding chaperone
MSSKSLIFCVAALAGFTALNGQDQSPSIAASGSPGAEQHPAWGRHRQFGYFLKQLALTDAQKQQVKLYLSDNKPTVRADRLNLLRAKQAVDWVIERNPSDEATIRSLSANAASFETELAAQRAQFDAFLQSLLTSEQKQDLAALRQKRDADIQAHQLSESIAG